MSYDIYLNEPDGGVIELDMEHEVAGGTFALGGTRQLWLNVTYNYAKFYYAHFDTDAGIRWLYDKRAGDTIERLEAAIKALGGAHPSKDYWEGTPGNAAQALEGLRAFAIIRPDGVWSGD